MSSPTIVFSTGTPTGQIYTTTNGNTPNLVVSPYTTLALFIQVFALTGGASPTLQFHMEYMDMWGSWYSAWDGSNYSSSTLQLQSFGPGCSQNQTFGDVVRVRWNSGGGPTSVTFNLQVVGK